MELSCAACTHNPISSTQCKCETIPTMLVLHDPDTLLHATVELFGGAKLTVALESPDRVRSILTSLDGSSHEVRNIHVNPDTGSSTPSLHDIVIKTHDPGYVHHLEHAFTDWLNAGLIKANESILPECFRLHNVHNPHPKPPKNIFARTGYYAFDMSTGIMESSYKSILASANLAYHATQLLFSAPSPTNTSPSTILALARPPGHHCNGTLAGGYCYLNNAAIAVATYHALSPSSPDHTLKTAILDLDFHHGNGTQELFYPSANTLYVSIHGEDEFPYYTGSASETGVGEGEGFNLNLPLPTDSSFAAYSEKLSLALKRIQEFEPKFLLLSLGFDTFHLDQLGRFGIETGDYEVMARETRKSVQEIERGRDLKCLILLEGGYVVEKLGVNMLSFLKGWEEDQ